MGNRLQSLRWNLLQPRLGESMCEMNQGVCAWESFPKLPLSFLFLKVVTNQFCHSLTELNSVMANQVLTLLSETIHDLTCIVSHD